MGAKGGGGEKAACDRLLHAGAGTLRGADASLAWLGWRRSLGLEVSYTSPSAAGDFGGWPLDEGDTPC